ncbi:MAG TPA: hypothetical protein VME44_14600 [Streptosporangiaceae bacterium]|nr:hypothetical protein [Streptosporangiaceae bacterium]
MSNTRDPIDDWLETEVTPLSPPPGSLSQIRQRAKRRKTRQASFVAVGCAVVLAGAVATPQVISALNQPRHHSPSVAIGSNSPPSVSGSPSPSTRPSPSQESKNATQIKQHTRLSTTTSGTSPPPHFRPTSATFVGNTEGGVVGAVVGQAGPPCATSVCTSLAGTSNYGKSWYGVSAPVAPGPSGDSGVSQLRFANLRAGWAYGPALYETSGGGYPWHPEDTYGYRVIDLETSPARAFAVFGTCYGTGADYAANCSSFSLWTSVPSSRTWTQVSVPSADDQMKSTSSAAPLLVISGDKTGYLLTPSGEVLSGPATRAGGSWSAVGMAKCKPGSPSTSGQAAGPTAQLASGPKLLLACATPTAGGRRFTEAIYTSATGATWQQVGSVTVRGTPTSLTAASSASAASGVVALATTDGIRYSADGGASWQVAAVTGNSPAGGFSYVGMTDVDQGIAVPANASLGEVYVTNDGGKTWQASPITS